VLVLLRRAFNNFLKKKQESCAIAKMTARYIDIWVPWKFLRLPDYAYGYFPQIVLMRFCSDRLYECARKFEMRSLIALAIPEIIAIGVFVGGCEP